MLAVTAPVLAGNCPPYVKGQVMAEGCSGGPPPDEPILPPGCPLPPGCDLKNPSTYHTCTSGTSACLCSALPGMHIIGSGDNQACVPDEPPKGCPKTGMPNAMGVATDPRCRPTPIRPLRAVDPNVKVGSFGARDLGFIAQGVPLSYAIQFENLPTANGAAQVVVVTDQLDLATFDLDTFQLGPISWGRLPPLVPAPGEQAFTGGIDLRPDQEIVVTVKAGLNRDTGLVTWTFISIDPNTGQLTDDPLAGFLPPNTSPPAGEGLVHFTISPKPGLASGTTIANQASIVFDLNPALATPTWVNTLDKLAPSTSVQPLAPVQLQTSFTVSWSGTDGGAGVAYYSVYVSDDGGPFTPWLERTAETSATFQGVVGHTYRFFSLGEDGVGNTEALKNTAEATTAVAGARTPTTTTLATSQSPSIAGTLITLTATVTGVAPGGTADFTDGVGPLPGCSGVPLAGPGHARTAQCAIATLAPGSYTLVANYVGDIANEPSSGSVSQQVDANCNAFSDVAGASAFCTSVEWLRNRAITAGCTATRYCPDSDVSRLAMAAFMRRAGAALTPMLVWKEASPGAIDPDGNGVVCPTDAFAVEGFPRQAFVDFVFAGKGGGEADIGVQGVLSLDDGATWTPLGTTPAVVAVRSGHWATVRGSRVKDLAVGQLIRFGVRVSRQGASSADLADSNCALRVRIGNRNGDATPYDGQGRGTQ